jgi:hypothetical protein
MTYDAHSKAMLIVGKFSPCPPPEYSDSSGKSWGYWRQLLSQAIRDELTAAVEAEREACAEIVREAVHRKEWHRSVGYALGRVHCAIRDRRSAE